jgi:hypothetical protein
LNRPAQRNTCRRADEPEPVPAPVLLQFGTESPRHLYATDALAAVLRDVRVIELED